MTVIDATQTTVRLNNVDVSQWIFSPLPTIAWADDGGRSTSFHLSTESGILPERGDTVVITESSVVRFYGVVSGIQTADRMHTIYAVDAEARLTTLGADYVRQEYGSKTESAATVGGTADAPSIPSPTGDIIDGTLYVPCYTSIDEIGAGGTRRDKFSYIVENASSAPYVAIESSFYLPEILYEFSFTMVLNANPSSTYYASCDWKVEVQIGPTGEEPYVLVDNFTMSSKNALSLDIRKVRRIKFAAGIQGSIRIKLTCSNFYQNWQSTTSGTYFKCGPLVGDAGYSNFVSIEPASGGTSSGEQFKSFTGTWYKGDHFPVSSYVTSGSSVLIKKVGGDKELSDVIIGGLAKYIEVVGDVAINQILAHACLFYNLTLGFPAGASNRLKYYVFRGKYLKDVFKSLLDIPQESGTWTGRRASIRGSLSDNSALRIGRVRDLDESPKYTLSYGDSVVLSANVVKKVSGLTNRIFLRSSAETGTEGQTRTLVTCVHGPDQSINIGSSKPLSEFKTVTALQGSGVGDLKNSRLADISGTIVLDGLFWDIVDSDETSDTYGDGCIVTYSDVDGGIPQFTAKVLGVSWDMDQAITTLTIGRMNPPSVSKLLAVDMDVQDTGATQDALGRYVGFCSLNRTISGNPSQMRIGTDSSWSPYVEILLTTTPYGRIAHGEFSSKLFSANGTHPITRVDLGGTIYTIPWYYTQDLSYDMDMLVVEVWYT